jgi:glycosyltransferase involved in cell wall biosynthesis
MLHSARMMTSTRPVPLTVVVLTYNEERNLAACLESVAGWVGEIFVVDSGSTDRTMEIAEQYGARVLIHPFESHAKQWNWALRHVPFSYEWALGLDADHRVTPELADEIARLFHTESDSPRRTVSLRELNGFYMKRRQIFRGRWVSHGGCYPKYQLKLFRHQYSRCDEEELVDHRFYIAGNSASLQSDLIEDNQNELDIMVWSQKHIVYAGRQAQEEFLRQHGRIGNNTVADLFGTPDQRRLWLKRIWYRLPIYVRPYLYFLYRYFLRLGFLDGKEGFLLHFLQGFWYRLLVDVALEDLRRGHRLGAELSLKVGTELSEKERSN